VKPSESTKDYEEGLLAGVLRVQRCEVCGLAQLYPRILCVHCGAQSLRWEEASGKGSIYSYTVVRRAPSPEFADDVPYALALVDLDEGPRVLARIAITDFSALACGARARFAQTRTERTPSFELESA
jgi:uncharacterized OB-fold protein